MATLAADASTAAPESRRMPAWLTSYGGLLLVGGAVVLLGVAMAARMFSAEDSELMARFWHAYLLGAIFASSISIGGLFFVIAHHLTGGRWGTSLRRLAEIIAGTMPLAAALMLPVVLNVASGSSSLYEWNKPVEDLDSILQAKAIYLNSKWFTIRSAIYFIVLIGLASFFIGGSLKQDETGKIAPLRRLAFWSGPSMLLFAVTLNFAAFDWLMSLAPHWFSTMFGVYFFAGSFIAFLATLILMTIGLQSMGVLTQSITTDNRHDAAKLMFAFVVFWGYITFSQFLLIWYANVPEETEWFGIRQSGETTMFGISWPLGLLFVTHLIIPFLGFMSRAVRRNKPAMIFWSIWMLVVHWLDMVFVVMPMHHGKYEHTSAFGMIGPMEIACTLGAIAVIAGAAIRGAEDRWLLALRDPRLKQATTYHNH